MVVNRLDERGETDREEMTDGVGEDADLVRDVEGLVMLGNGDDLRDEMDVWCPFL